MVKTIVYTPHIEASHFIKRAPLSRVPYLSREDTVRFVDSLYAHGAMSVEVSKIRTIIGSNWFIELYVRSFDLKMTEKGGIREILRDILRTNPFAVEEIKTHVFRVGWKLEE